MGEAGGGSATRRKSLLALGALLALIASVLAWASPIQAQGTNQPPTAIALPVAAAGSTDTYAGGGTIPVGDLVLDGTLSFDPDDEVNANTGPCVGCEFKWEIVTTTYKFLEGFAEDGDGDATNSSLDDAKTTIKLTGPPVINLVSLVQTNGAIIEFKLTVTDAKGASDSVNVTYNIETTDKPTADIAVTATTSGDGVDANNDGTISALEKFSDDAVIDGPGENGNADNEYDIKEDSLLVLDASGSSDSDTPQASLTYTWALLFETGQTGTSAPLPRATNSATQASTLAPTGNSNLLYNVGTNNSKVSTNDPSDDSADPPVIQTVGRLNVGVRNQSPYYAIYQLTVTDGDNNSSTATVRIAIHDQPADPTVSISIEGDSTGQSAAQPDTPDVDAANSPGVYRAGLQGTLPPGSGRYVVHAGEDFTLNATAYDADFDTDGNGSHDTTEGGATGAPAAVWSGDLEDEDTSTAGFQVEIPDDAEDGDSYTITSTIRGTEISKSVTFVVQDDNTRPVATVLSPAASDQAGASPGATIRTATVRDGVYTVNGFGFDPDGGSVTTVWTQLINGKQAEADHDDYVALTGAFSNSVSFNKPTNPKHSGSVVLSLAVIDQHGAFQIQLVQINIDPDDPTLPRVSAGSGQVVAPKSTVILTGSVSGNINIGLTNADNSVATWTWTVTGLSTDPDPGDLTKTLSDDVHESLNDFFLDQFAPTGSTAPNGIFDPVPDGVTFDADTHDRLIRAVDVDSDGVSLWPLTAISGQNGQHQYFTAPELANGLKYAQIEFTLVATLTSAIDHDGDSTTAAVTALPAAEVTITIADKFFSSYIDNPGYCEDKSLGGPQTYPHDSNGDSVADTCSLESTRREAVARQNALEQLADLGLTISVTDTAARTSDATLWDLVRGRDGKDAVGNVDSTGYEPAVSAIVGTCTQVAGLNLRHDDPDACDTKAPGLTPLPDPVDPADAALFYSGIVTGPDFCTDRDLGGPRTFAHDGDGDGVADVCSLHTTRREAVARQKALVLFEGKTEAEKKRFDIAFKAACAALGSETFGESAAALAADACSVGLNPSRPNPGNALP